MTLGIQGTRKEKIKCVKEGKTLLRAGFLDRVIGIQASQADKLLAIRHSACDEAYLEPFHVKPWKGKWELFQCFKVLCEREKRL